MNKKHLKNLLISLIPLSAILLVGIVFLNAGIITTDNNGLNPNEINATLLIDYGDGEKDEFNIQIKNPTVYTLLLKASKEYNFDVKSDYQEQYQSHYIYSINSREEGEGLYWQYYLNTEYGIVGADMQSLKNNDVVEWKLEGSQV